MGPAGPAGLDYRPAGYVGSQACAECHEEIATIHSQTGHAYILNRVVDGQPPAYPATQVSDPPEGYTWDDILYVVGGYGWKAVFIDQSGNLITGTETINTQFNFANRDLGTDDEWVAFHVGETQAYTCGECHTTGYVPEGNQHDLPGLIGTWAEDGVGCEACHGPGGNHANDPYVVDMEIERDSEACANCHSFGAVNQLEATEDGFIHNYQTYDELFLTKKRVMDCVDCHDPHAGTRTQEGRGLAIKTECETCHFEKETAQKLRRHPADCVDCHMPYWSKSAAANPELFTADLRTHMMSINPAATGMVEDGVAHAYLSIDASCKACHTPGSRRERSDEQLRAVATGYHDPDLAGTGPGDEEAPADETPAADETPEAEATAPADNEAPADAGTATPEASPEAGNDTTDSADSGN